MQESALKTNNQSLGGYVTGDLTATVGERTYYLAVGQQGGDAILKGKAAGGWPGGGKGFPDQNDNESGGGGGGFSAIYLETFTSTTATNFDKLKTRIMVAGAGGGCTMSGASNSFYYGAGGGLSGISSRAAAGTQDSGNAMGIGKDATHIGGSGYNSDTGTGGGGGGYWGGLTSTSTSNDYDKGQNNGGGGSSFASGMTGCKAITETSTSSSISYRTGSDATIHYSGLKFTNASTIAGNASMPNPAAATGNITGNPNNGYIRITCKPYGN